MVGEKGEDRRVGGKGFLGETLQRALRADLDEDPDARFEQGLQALRELHRGGHLPREQVEDGRPRVGAGWVQPAREVRHDGDPRRPNVEPLEDVAERLGSRRHDRGVERVADGQRNHGPPDRLEGRGRPLDGRGLPPDHRLRTGVVVRHDDVAVDCRQHLLDLVERREDGRHPARVLHAHVSHLPAPRAHGLERLREGQDTGGDERRVLAEAVAHHEIGPVPALGQQPRQREVDREDGGLQDARVEERLFGTGDRRGIAGVREDAVGQAPVEDRLHDRISLGEGLADGRLRLAQGAEHVHVLRALSAVEERDAAGRPSRAEDPHAAQGLPEPRLVGAEGGESLAGPTGQLVGVAELDAQPFGRERTGIGAGVRFLRHMAGRRFVSRAAHGLGERSRAMQRSERAADGPRPAARRRRGWRVRRSGQGRAAGSRRGRRPAERAVSSICVDLACGHGCPARWGGRLALRCDPRDARRHATPWRPVRAPTGGCVSLRVHAGRWQTHRATVVPARRRIARCEKSRLCRSADRAPAREPDNLSAGHPSRTTRPRRNRAVPGGRWRVRA